MTTQASFTDILEASKVIKQHLEPSPLIHSPILSSLYGCDISIKLENLNVTGSFKERGVIYKLSKLSPEECKKGVIATSAGNHAQALAYHAQKMQIPATIVMPETAPFVKIINTEKYGAKVILHGNTLEDAFKYMKKIIEEEDRILVHPYDDPYIVAGQGTIAHEIFTGSQNSHFDNIIVPIGGGGLISGIAIATKELAPNCKVIGVESEMYPSAYQAIYHQEIHCKGLSLADGIAVKKPGKMNLKTIESLVEEISIVDELAIEKAILSLSIDQKIIVEGSGATGLAVIMNHPEKFKGRKVCLILSGGNIDRRVLSSIFLRGLAREGRMVRLRIQIIDAPGQLALISKIIAGEKANIIEVQHKRLLEEITARQASLDVVMETKGLEHSQKIITLLEEAGFNCSLQHEIAQ